VYFAAWSHPPIGRGLISRTASCQALVLLACRKQLLASF